MPQRRFDLLPPHHPGLPTPHHCRSGLEDSRLNYIEQHAERLGLDAGRLEGARVAASQGGLAGETLDLCARQGAAARDRHLTACLCNMMRVVCTTLLACAHASPGMRVRPLGCAGGASQACGHAFQCPLVPPHRLGRKHVCQATPASSTRLRPTAAHPSAPAPPVFLQANRRANSH